MSDIVQRGPVRSVCLVEVIAVSYIVGKGTQSDPIVSTTDYYTKDGRFLAGDSTRTVCSSSGTDGVNLYVQGSVT